MDDEAAAAYVTFRLAGIDPAAVCRSRQDFELLIDWLDRLIPRDADDAMRYLQPAMLTADLRAWLRYLYTPERAAWLRQQALQQQQQT